MESFNTVALTGFLELDLTTRWQGESSQCTTFTMRLEEQGADKVHLVYVPVVCWGKTAERAADLSPGDVIGVQGKLVFRRAPDRPGEHTGRLAVMASSVVCVVPDPVRVASPPAPAGGDLLSTPPRGTNSRTTSRVISTE